MLRRVLLVFAGVTLTACAAATPVPRSSIASAGRDVITATEIVASHVTDVYQAVAQLRPEFLRRRGATAMMSISTPSVTVYLDDLPYGGAESLHTIPLDRVRIIRYIEAGDAEMRWGGMHRGGVILVTTMR